MIRFAFVSFLALGCDCGATGETADCADGCSDADRDGYGVGCGCAGPDCDDTNPRAHAPSECESVCDGDPTGTGCPCDGEEPEVCYAGPAGTAGVGACDGGVRTCVDGAWSACDGQVLPSEEVCDGTDDDCDGTVDDGVTSECGDCDPTCHEDCVGTGDACEDFDPAEEGNGVEPCGDDPDCLTLGSDAWSLGVIWIPSTAIGTVSKISTDTREELARYYTGPVADAGTSCGAGVDAHCPLNPSRTTVNLYGDGIVANRNFGGVASVAKILGTDCPDSDGDGVVETSSGRDDVLAWDEADAREDECVLWYATVGGVDGIARALAVQERTELDGASVEYVWVGLHGTQRFYEIEGATGEATGVEVDVAPGIPYGAAIDRDGNLWSDTYFGSWLTRFDTANPDDVENIATPSVNYGMTVDEEGRVWLGGQPKRYDPATGEFEDVDVGFIATHTNIVTGVAADGRGDVWMAHEPMGPGGEVYRVDADTLEIESVVALEVRPHGMAVDFDGNVWAISVAANDAAVIDPDDESVDVVLDECAGGCLGFPYAYSDMTGLQLHNQVDPFGRWQHVFEGCDGVTTWRSLALDVDLPPATAIEVAVRTADTLAALGAAAWIDAGTMPPAASPVDVEAALEAAGAAPGAMLEVRLSLRSDDGVAAPRLRSVAARFACGAGVE